MSGRMDDRDMLQELVQGNSPLLAQGRWQPENYQRLLAWLAEQRAVNVERQAESPRYVVFDWDNTCLIGDIGTATWWRQIEEMLFCFDHPDFWSLFDHFERKAQLRQDAEHAQALTPDQRADDPIYRRYLSGMVDAYWDLEEAGDSEASYPWQSKLLVGLSKTDVVRLTERTLEAELGRDFGTIELEHLASLQRALPCGIRTAEEIGKLVAALRAVGIESWIVSATHQWIVETVAPLYEIPADHVIGMRLELCDGTLTTQVIKPVTVKEGKVKAIQTYIHPTARPLLVAGDSSNDWPMLEYSQGLRLFFDRAGSSITERARQMGEGWLVQRQFENG